MIIKSYPMKALILQMAVISVIMVTSHGLLAQTVTGSGDPNYIPLWISTGSGGGGGGNEESGTTTVLDRTNMYYLGGNLGIGTTYPIAKLHVNGEIVAGDT